MTSVHNLARKEIVQRVDKWDKDRASLPVRCYFDSRVIVYI